MRPGPCPLSYPEYPKGPGTVEDEQLAVEEVSRKPAREPVAALVIAFLLLLIPALLLLALLRR
jgi:hypothetical protein